MGGSRKLDFVAFCLFLLAVGQNMTGVGSDWIGFGMFYAVGLILTINVVNFPKMAEVVPWQFRFI